MQANANRRLVAALRASRARAPIVTEDDVLRRSSAGETAGEEKRETAGPRRLPTQRHPLTVLLLAAYRSS